jgi:hypothetical protein
MPTLRSQQALKALCSPLRNLLRNPLRGPLRDPLRNPLRNLLHTRHIHTELAPFSGPPSYATIARRFSSYPNPMTFFTEKKAKEAIDRGEFIDIHDVGGVEPEDFDVLISDMNHNNLRSDVAELIGMPYLGKATTDEANKVVDVGHGIVYGRKLRPILPCIVSSNDKAYWVFFIYDTSAPLTYLSTQVSALHIEIIPGC